MKIGRKIERQVKKDVREVKRICHITPKYLRHKWLAIYSLGLLFSQILLGISYYSGSSLITESPQIMAKNIVVISNADRNASGLSTLNENDLLDKAAKDKLDDMFNNNYWDHYSPQGKKPWDFMTSEKYSYLYAGENLAKGFLDSSSTVKAWMASPSHRENLLSNKYKDIGVAVGTGNIDGKPTTLVVQMFGSPQLDNVPTRVASATNQKVVIASASKVKEAQINPDFAIILARVPFFILWFIIFCLIVFDGTIIRRCGLHASRRHMFEFRSALLVNILVLIALSINFVAIS